MMHLYTIEMETEDHRFVFRQVEAADAERAKGEALKLTPGRHLGVSLVACEKTAPEFGSACKRELIR